MRRSPTGLRFCLETGMKTLERAADGEEIRGRLRAVEEGDAARWGVMDAGQMVVHVREAFRVAMAEGVAEPVKGPLPPKVMKFAALWVPREWPKTVQTVPELKIGAARMAVCGFAADREGLMVELERFQGMKELTKDHPIFGAMRHEDWMRWGYLHADHHLRQFGR